MREPITSIMEQSPHEIAGETTGDQALQRADLDPDPIRQFSIWFAAAAAAEIPEANAMNLATVTPDRTPAVRVVLLKGFDQRGFVFFTNYSSEKGRQLEANPKAALSFYWKE